jgi:hypothetical protein
MSHIAAFINIVMDANVSKPIHAFLSFILFQEAIGDPWAKHITGFFWLFYLLLDFYPLLAPYSHGKVQPLDKGPN